MKFDLHLTPPEGHRNPIPRTIRLRTEWFLATRPSFPSFLKELEPEQRIDHDEHELAFGLFLRRHARKLLGSPNLSARARIRLHELRNLVDRHGWHVDLPTGNRAPPDARAISCSTCQHCSVVRERYQRKNWNCDRFPLDLEQPTHTWCSDHHALPWNAQRPLLATELLLDDPGTGETMIIHREAPLPTSDDRSSQLADWEQKIYYFEIDHLQYITIPQNGTRKEWQFLNHLFSRFTRLRYHDDLSPQLVQASLRLWCTPDDRIRLEDRMTRKLATEAMGLLAYNIVRLGDNMAHGRALSLLDQRLRSGLWDLDVLQHIANRIKAQLPSPPCSPAAASSC